jgi:glycosyltransferase involved in cell wall biosynthesis
MKMSTHYISESYFNRRLSDKKSVEAQLHLEQSAVPIELRWWPEGTEVEPPVPGTPDLICFSHLRWDFVYQRPQHLLNRCAQTRRVFIVEEPIATPEETSWLDISKRDCGVWIVVPQISESLSDQEFTLSLQRMLNALLVEAQIQRPILWYYTPMAVPFTSHLQSSAVVYDCMDELSAFKGAHPQLQTWEARLFELADLVFTGGHSLYEAKQHQHPNVHAFPSSIDAAHFAQARNPLPEPADQADIPHPRMGFYGVIDERLDLELLDGIAEARPDWHLVMVGPVVKIDPASLPQRPNIHYLGSKPYQELPYYLAGWDAALLLFARNESTRFISPTKTPEYLAAGKPVVSTSIRDVVRPYGDENLVHIADTVPEFVEAIAAALDQSQTSADWLDRVDARLAQTSWDLTWQTMNDRIEEAIAANASKLIPTETTAPKTKYPTAIAANLDQLAI